MSYYKFVGFRNHPKFPLSFFISFNEHGKVIHFNLFRTWMLTVGSYFKLQTIAKVYEIED